MQGLICSVRGDSRKYDDLDRLPRSEWEPVEG